VREELPRGTVTFLFTDVEGSTRLLEELSADGYAAALAEHRRVIREACGRHGGVEVDTQGDAFFFAFPTAPGALHAARVATESLAAGPIQVRIGLHTGTPLVTDEGYVGEDVHFAARVAASSHGGQVVLSQATRGFLDDGFPLTDLGEHRLKDIAEPVSIFQLGDGSFPPLKTISNTNLPRPASSFVGREAELAEVLARVAKGARLLTLTGPGGSGKTRLALEAAASLVPAYKAGVFWVGLAALRDPALVMETVAQTLGAKDGLAEHVGEREMLLLLDNLEQVIEATPELSALVTACPNLTLLATSRELLRVQGEVEYPVPPLAQPEAVALFRERAQLEPSEEIAELCVRLDNLPLAVELAAARTKALSPAQILERLSQRLDLLKGGRDADPRQQTLRATIEWSYDLLSEDEQRLFARLSVFAGGCTLEAAEEVAEADLDTLQSLVEKSLLRFSGGRYWMLETIREFAGEYLETSGQADEPRKLHAARYGRVAVELAGPLRGYSADALATVQDELDNMRDALEFALDRDDVVNASDLMSGLWFFWLTSGRGGEAIGWARRYLASPGERVGSLERFQGDLGAAEILRFAGDPSAAAELKRELVATGRAHPDAVIQGVAIERSIAATLSDLAYIELDAGRLDEARTCAEEALLLRRKLGLPHGIAHALLAVAAVEYNAGDPGRAGEVYAEAAAVSEEAGSHGDALEARLELAECELLLGRLTEAAGLLRTALDLLPGLQDQSIEILALRVAGMLAAANGETERCAILFGATDGKLRDGGLVLFSPLEEEIRRSFAERAQHDLGESRFRAAYERGIEERDSIGPDLALRP
jgi:predicted ATPase/class 3 adenylate cyclase